MERKNYRIIALDMDGTLLNDGGKVSRRSVEIINELIKNGMLFTVDTA